MVKKIKSISIKLLIGFLLASIIPIVVLGTITFINATSIIEQSGNNRILGLAGIETIADLKVREIETFFNERNEDITSAQHYLNIRKNLPILNNYFNDKTHPDYINAKKELDSQLKSMQQGRDFLLEILLLGPEGNIMYVTGNVHKNDEIGTKFPNEEIIQKGRNEVHFTEIFESPFYEGFELLTAAPVYHINNSFVGIVVMAIDMTKVYNLVLDYTGLGETGETLIGRKLTNNEGPSYKGHTMEQEGEYALFLNPLRHDPDAALKKAAFFKDENAYPIKEAVSGRSGSGQSVDYRGEQIIAAWRPLNLPSRNLEWGLVAKIDEAEVLSVTNNLRTFIALSAVIMIIFVIILSYMFSRSISRPISKLNEATQKLGKGQLSTMVKITSGDELQELGDAFNITSSKLRKAHDDLTASEEKFKQIANTITDVFWLTDWKTKKVLFCSPAYEKVWNISVKQLYKDPLNWSKPIHKDDKKKVEKAFINIVRNKGYDIEFRLVKKDGSIRWIHDKGVPVKNKKGQVYRIVGVAHDITELKKVDQMKDELISIAGHELKTPLTSINSLSQLIYDQKLGKINKKQKDSLQVVIKDAKRLHNLIESMLDVSRFEEGRIRYDYSKFNMEQIVKDAIKTAEELAKEKKIKIKLESLPCQVYGDKIRIGQTIINLITNSIKYGKEKGHIWIKCGKKGNSIVVSVKDDGVGISKENLPKVFKRMFQVDQSHTRIAGGAGFGLYISKKIIEEGHKGKMWIESELGKGSTFYFSLSIGKKYLNKKSSKKEKGGNTNE